MRLLAVALLGCSPCPDGAVPDGEARVRALCSDADLPTGPGIAARVGDYVLENGTSRFVVRAVDEGHALVGLAGGGLVDAVRVVDGAQAGGDGLREYAITAGFRVLRPTAFNVDGDGLIVEGDLVDFDSLLEVLPTAAPQATLTTEYRLAPDSPVLTVRTHIDGEAAIGDLLFFTGDVQPFLPGHDPWALPVAAVAPMVGAATRDPARAPAIAVDTDTDRSLLVTGPVRALLYASATGAVTRRVALGEDFASAAAWLQPASEHSNDHALVEARDADGGPLSRCRSPMCPFPTATAEVVPIWIGDGNGGLGGAGQDGSPATLEVTAPGPFRLTARRSDGLRRYAVDGDGEAAFLVPPGTWEVWVTAGPTFTLDHGVIELAAGEVSVFDADIEEVVDTTGWSAADLHVHVDTSPDSDVPAPLRLTGAAAEHLDYVVLTDHDFVGWTPAAPGLEVRVGVEVSTMRLGHFGSWPMPTDDARAGNGAPDWYGHSWDTLLPTLGPMLQCNHPRFVDGGYAASFEEGLDPGRCPLVEVVNGFASDDTAAVLADWLGALDRGDRPVATGTSDSHGVDDFVGNPRTWIHATGDADALDAALLAGRAVASGGPFVTLTLAADGAVASVGETLEAAGPITASIDVQAPEWMALGEVVLVVDGRAVEVVDVASTAAVAGLRRVLVERPVSPESYVVAVHRATAASWPGTHRPGDAVTNPVFVR